MSTIRRQSIISSLVIYIGFAVGMVNLYFFARYFEPAQYGLTSIFIALSTMMSAFAAMAMPSYIQKFYPYYKDHLPERKMDMITLALIISTIGFLLVIIAGWLFKGLVIRKFGANSPQLLTYYYWIFPMGFGLTIFAVLEAFTWNLRKSVLTSFLREVLWRLFTTALIILFIGNVIRDFDLFIKLYALGYPFIAITLLSYLVFTGKVHLTFSISKVSRRFFRKIVSFCLFVYSAIIVNTISQVIDSIVIASVLEDGMTKAGIFTLAQTMSGIIQAPQRAIIATTIPHLARAWKEKNHQLLQRIYQRSSLNQLIFASGLFMVIALNYTEAIYTFDLRREFLLGFNAFIILGLNRIIDMGTGVNAQIIGTSNRWRFELTSGIILLILMLPLTIILTRQYGLLGPPIANLISITIFNIIRLMFLWLKFRLFPFTIQSLYTVLMAGLSFIICFYAFRDVHGLGGLVLRSLLFMILYGGAVIYFKLTPDLEPVIGTVRKRLGIKNKESGIGD
jgi:O-antigen/teichoic acid export membrane protein